MTYRIHVIDRDGHALRTEVAECADDKEALDRATQMANGHDVEIWDHKRFVTLLPGNLPKA